MTTPYTALVEALPPLPYACGEAVMDLCADHQGPIEAMQFLAEGTMLYTADQMRAYGEACARAALAQAEAAQPQKPICWASPMLAEPDDEDEAQG